MAWYENAERVRQLSGDKDFAAIHSPGARVPHSGIYICVNCKREVTSNSGDPFPPQNHHQHPASGPVQWKLLVYTNTTGV